MNKNNSERSPRLTTSRVVSRKLVIYSLVHHPFIQLDFRTISRSSGDSLSGRRKMDSQARRTHPGRLHKTGFWNMSNISDSGRRNTVTWTQLGTFGLSLSRLTSASGPSTYPANRDFEGHVGGVRGEAPGTFFIFPYFSNLTNSRSLVLTAQSLIY